MGLFGSKKTYVSSSIYNMAGDINQRPNFLKTIITNHMIADDGRSITEAIQASYLAGPGMRLRRYARWCDDGNYPAIGVGQANLYTTPSVSSDDVLPLVPHDIDETVNIQRLEYKNGEYSYWAEQWMLDHYPELITSKWTSNISGISGEIIITFEDGTSASFEPADFDQNARYFYVLYNLARASETGDWVIGETVQEPFPSVTGWTAISSSASTDTRTLSRIVKTTKSYSDGRPDVVTTVNTTSNQSYTYFRGVYEKLEYKGTDDDNDPTTPDQIYSLKSRMFLARDGYVTDTVTTTKSQEEQNDGRLIVRTTVETHQEVLSVVTTDHVDTQVITSETFSATKLLIYKMGSGNATLDAKVNARSDDGFYMPFMPIRLDNKQVDETNFPSLREQNEKAYKKLTGSDTYGDDLADAIAKNKDVKDMDYAYMMLGVSLNTKSNSAKKYLYLFFERLRLTQAIGAVGAYSTWDTNQAASSSALSEWMSWKLSQNSLSDGGFGGSAPSFGGAYSAPTNEIHIQGSGDGSVNTNMDITITWGSIERVIGTGAFKDGAKAGDCWVEFGGSGLTNISQYLAKKLVNTVGISSDQISITRQIDDNNWSSLIVSGLKHKNNIYNGKSVEISAQEAMQDDEESGFLVPIHYETYKSMSLVDATQMSMACAYVVVNSYKVVKTGFFQSIFFKIIQVIVVIAVAILAGPQIAMLVNALFALVTGFDPFSIVNVILTKIISKITIAVFGEKAGRIIASIIVVVGEMAAVIASGGASAGQVLSQLAKPENIAQIAAALGSAVAGEISLSAYEKQQQTQKLVADYGKEVLRINDLYAKNIGTDRAQLDPLANMRQGGMTELALYETPGMFLERTLLTGSDIAEVSMSIVSNFTEATLAISINT